MQEKIKLSKKDRISVAWRHQFLQGSWNYERMQNGNPNIKNAQVSLVDIILITIA